MRASSCRRARGRRGSSRSSWSSRAAMRKARRRPRRIPARLPARTRSTTRRFGAPACCACSISTSCSPPPRRWAAAAVPGKRLAILTNGGGVGVLAVDRLVDLGGTLAGISPATMRRSSGAAAELVAGQSGRHRRRRRCRALCRRARASARGSRERRHPGHERSDGACLGAGRAARSVADRGASAPQRRDPAEARFRRLGRQQDAVTPVFEADGIPHYATEADAVRGFMHLVRYREAQDDLMATPPSLPQDFEPDVAAARGDRRRGRAERPHLARSDGGRRGCSRPMPSRSRPPFLAARCRRGRRRRGAPLLAERIGAWRSRSFRPTSFTNRTSAASGSTSRAKTAVREAVEDILARARAAQARCAHHRRHRSSDDRAPEGAGADRRHRGRSDLRPRHGVRLRRHRGRGHRRQGAGAAAARSRSSRAT